MKQDIRKLALWLEKVCQEGVEADRKLLEWKLAEAKKATPEALGKSS